MFERFEFPAYEFREFPKHIATGKFHPEQNPNGRYDPLAGTEITVVVNTPEEEAAVMAKISPEPTKAESPLPPSSTPTTPVKK